MIIQVGGPPIIPIAMTARRVFLGFFGNKQRFRRAKAPGEVSAFQTVAEMIRRALLPPHGQRTGRGEGLIIRDLDEDFATVPVEIAEGGPAVRQTETVTIEPPPSTPVPPEPVPAPTPSPPLDSSSLLALLLALFPGFGQTPTETVRVAFPGLPTRGGPPVAFPGPVDFGGGFVSEALRQAPAIISALRGSDVSPVRMQIPQIATRFLGFGNGNGNGVPSILQRASQACGRRVTKRDVIMAAKHCGIELAAQSHCMTEIEACQIIAKGMPRRRRGISAADLRRTRATIRKVNTIRKSLKTMAR